MVNSVFLLFIVAVSLGQISARQHRGRGALQDTEKAGVRLLDFPQLPQGQAKVECNNGETCDEGLFCTQVSAFKMMLCLTEETINSFEAAQKAAADKKARDKKRPAVDRAAAAQARLWETPSSSSSSNEDKKTNDGQSCPSAIPTDGSASYNLQITRRMSW